MLVQKMPFAITDPSRRGVCPTLTAPMQTGDGLLARVRIAGSRLNPDQLARLAALADQHGNGIIEITARGNLQVRGLTPDSTAPFAEAVTTLLPIETGLVVDVSPLAGYDPHERADPRPLADRIRAAALPVQEQLGPKVSVVIDGCGQISLTELKADIRLVAQDAQTWAVHLGGGKPQVMEANAAISTTMAMLGALAALGPDARATDLFPSKSALPPLPNPPRGGEGAVSRLGQPAETVTSPAPPPLRGRLGGGGRALALTNGLTTGHTIPLTLPFGQIEAKALASLAQSPGLTNIRLAPNHSLLLDNAPANLIEHAETLGFITGPTDPRLTVSACIGSDGCASGHIAARRLATDLARHVPSGQHLHVSGCTKGCAHPRRADVTLVGRTDGIGLVIDGRAGDTPQAILDEAGLIPALARQEGR